MRSDLEHNRGRGLTLIATKLGTFKRQLNGDITLSAESTNNLLDPNGADRIVTLPAVATGVFMVISNTAANGTNFNIIVKNNAGTVIVILSPQDSTWLVGNDNTFYAVSGLNSVFGPSGPNHKVGLVPDPGAVPGTTRVLKEDGTWGTFAAVANDSYAHITNGTITTNASGLDTFKVRSSSGKIGITVQENDVTHGDNADFTVLEAAVDHNSLLNFVANKHIDHSAVSISSGEGLSGGGDLTVSRTLALAFTALVAATPVLGDTLAFYDQSAVAHRKMLVSELNSILAHDSLAGFVGTKHIDHSLVFTIAGAGLSGGGDHTATRTLSLDINSLTAQASMGANDYLAFYDVGGADHNKLTLTQLAASLTGIGFGGGGGGGTPGGANTQIQFNDAGAFGGDADFTWDKTNNVLAFGATGVQIVANSVEAMRIDAVQRVIVGGGGASIGVDGGTTHSRMQLHGIDFETGSMFFSRWSLNNSAPKFFFGKSRGTLSTRTFGVVANNDMLGLLQFQGDDGAAFQQAAVIQGVVDGTPGLGDMPGRLEFLTSPDGTTVSVERMRIDSAGRVGIGGLVNASPFNFKPRFQINGQNASIQFNTWTNLGGDGTEVYFSRSNSPTPGAHALVASGETIGWFDFSGSDGVAFKSAARIRVVVDGTPALNDMPGRIEFYTTPDGSTSLAERMRIDNTGRITNGGTAEALVWWGNKANFTIYKDSISNVADGSIGIARYSADTGGTNMYFTKSRGLTRGTNTALLTNDTIAFIAFFGADGTALEWAADMRVEVDGAPTSNLSTPGRFRFCTAPSGSPDTVERLRIGSAGHVSIGGAIAPVFNFGGEASRLQIIGGNSGGDTSIAALRYSANNSPPRFILVKSRGAVGAHGLVPNGDMFGELAFVGSDGAAYQWGASIQGAPDGTTAANDMPGKLTFLTSPDGTVTPIERMRIGSDGTVSISNNGTGPTFTQWGFKGTFQLNRIVGTNNPLVTSHCYANNSESGWWSFVKSRGVTSGELVETQSGDGIFYLSASGVGSNLVISQAGVIGIDQDGAAGVNSVPGKITFSTTVVAGNDPVERMRIDNAGRTILGGVASQTGGRLQNHGTTLATSSIDNARWSNDGSGAWVNLYKSHAVGIGVHGLVSTGDTVATIDFYGSDGTQFLETAKIMVSIDGVAALNDMPGRIQFYTTPDGSASLLERMRIASNGGVAINTVGTTVLGGPVRLTVAANGGIDYAFRIAGFAGGNYTVYTSTLNGDPDGHTSINSGNFISIQEYRGSDGVAFRLAAQINIDADGAPATSTVPGRIVFSTTPPGVSQNPVERVRITSFGGVGIGTGGLTTGLLHVAAGSVTHANVAGSNQAGFEIFAYDTGSGGLNVNHYLNLVNYNNDGYGEGLTMKYSRGTAQTRSIVQNNDALGFLNFMGGNGTGFTNAARISAAIDGTPGAANDMPGRLVFGTVSDGSGTVTDRLWIDSAGIAWLMNAATKQGNVNETVALYNHEALGGI